MGFSGYPEIKLEARVAVSVENYSNSFSILASKGYKALMPEPSIEQQLFDDKIDFALRYNVPGTEHVYRITDRPEFDPLFGTQGVLMLPRIYDTENNYLPVKYKRTHGQAVREGDYSGFQNSDGTWISNFEDLAALDAALGVDIDTRFTPVDIVFDGVDYSKSSHQWQEVWAERVVPRVWPPSWESPNGKSLYYTDYYSVKLHQDKYKERANAVDPLLNPPTDSDGDVTQPDLHFCIQRLVPFPDMPAYRTAVASDYDYVKKNNEIIVDEEDEVTSSSVDNDVSQANNEAYDEYLEAFSNELSHNVASDFRMYASATSTTDTSDDDNTVLEKASKPMHGFWVDISRAEASVSAQSKDTSDMNVNITDEANSDARVVFDLAYEEPFISVGFGKGGSKNPRVEIVFPVSRQPYAVLWRKPAEGNKDRTANAIRPLSNAIPVMTSNFAVFVYVMLGEVAIRVTTGDLSSVIWEDKIISGDVSSTLLQDDIKNNTVKVIEDNKEGVKIDSASPYVRGKNMRCTVGMSRVKFKRFAVLYTPQLWNFENDPENSSFRLQGAYGVQSRVEADVMQDGEVFAVNGDPTFIYPQDNEPTPDKAADSGGRLNNSSFIPGTSIEVNERVYRDSKTSNRFQYYWRVGLNRDLGPKYVLRFFEDIGFFAWVEDDRYTWDETSNQYISPLLFYIEGRITPYIQTFPDWYDITNVLTEANIDQSAPDFFAIDQYMSLSLIDDDIIVDNPDDDFSDTPISMNAFTYFQGGAREIRLTAGWYDDDPDPQQPADEYFESPQLLFTGFVSNVSLDWQRPFNVLSLTVVTLMERMKNIPILQSPYYDGQETGGVIKDLVQKGQLLTQIVTTEVVDGEEETVSVNTEPWVKFMEDGVDVTETGFIDTEFFLGVGNDFQSAQFKFDGGTMIMECIKAIMDVEGARVYAAPNGQLVYAKFSNRVLGGEEDVKILYSYPSTNATLTDDHSEYDTLFGGLSFERTAHDAVNEIFVFTVDRDTRTAAVGHVIKRSTSDASKIDTSDVGYIKTVRIDNPALGDLRSARSSALRIANFMFYPPRRASFSCWGHPELLPLDFIRIYTTKKAYDEHGLGTFLITSISSKISKDAEEFTYEADYEVEYLGNPSKISGYE